MKMRAFWILCLILSTSFMSPGTASVVNNEVDDNDMDVPTCEAKSACGFLQANTRGISRVHLCKCPKSLCPMRWNENDGFSVTRGSEQYKFCGPAPKLKPCNTTHLEVAYTGRMQYSYITGQQTRSERLHCACQAGEKLYSIPSKVRSRVPGTKIQEWTYVCAPYKECQPGAACMTITENGREYFERRRCNCPEGQRCPTTTVNATKRTNYWDGESVYDVKCQI